MTFPKGEGVMVGEEGVSGVGTTRKLNLETAFETCHGKLFSLALGGNTLFLKPRTGISMTQWVHNMSMETFVAIKLCP